MASVQQQCKAVRQAARAGQADEALALARELVQANPRNLLANRLMAWLGLERGSRDTMHYLQQCAALDPEDPLAEIGQAIFAERHGVTESALHHFRRAAALAPDDQRVREEIVRLGGDVEDSPLGSGVIGLQDGDVDGAGEALRRAVEERPEDLAAKLLLARALWLQGAVDQAVTLANQVLVANPHAVAALMILYAAEKRRGRVLQGRKFDAQAQEIDPGFTLHAPLAAVLSLSGGR
jgi:Tfp pilus assembly protein PilF